MLVQGCVDKLLPKFLMHSFSTQVFEKSVNGESVWFAVPRALSSLEALCEVPGDSDN